MLETAPDSHSDKHTIINQAMSSSSVHRRIADRYADFADQQARGASKSYQALARHVSQSKQAVDFLATLPAGRQQPNLFLAAVRLVAGYTPTPRRLLRVLSEHRDQIAEVMTSRTTQTNEPWRCAVLLPALARIGGPIALLEIGASAGLCLLPDKYAYDYGNRHLGPVDDDSLQPPVFDCEASRNTPLPEALPEIVWRAGIDLNPLNVQSDDDVAWLETLIWPEQSDRLQRFRAAVAVAKRDPPLIVKGDAIGTLRDVAAMAPSNARLVLFHTAVATYMRPLDRVRLARLAAEIGATWISNEAPSVFPEFAKGAVPKPRQGLMFVLAIDGVATAWTHPHGKSIHWLA